MNMTRRQVLLMGSYLIGMASLLLQGCAGGSEQARDRLCGNWESVAGKPDILIYKEGEAYKVTIFKRSGLSRQMKPETYLLQEEEGGNLFINTGFRIDVAIMKLPMC